MVSLLRLTAYSPEQLQLAQKWSPALLRYLQMLGGLSSHAIHAQRHTAWSQCVLATFFQTATTSEICQFWSDTADRLLRQVWTECGLDQIEVVLFALGKHGAFELNLSSDIDLLVVSEGQNSLKVERGLRQFQKRLHQPGEFGFCYRLDFDLRPGGKMGPWVTTPSQFQDYYWSQGETWERLALVRLRAIAGSPNLAQQVLDLARRFSYRKFLDYTLLDDLKALRAQVHQFGFQRQVGQLNLKLEVGGIRDIELFVHSLLVLNGGKIPRLQTTSTSQALLELRQQKLLQDQEADLLLSTYWYFRNAENIIQGQEDRQTHVLTSPPPEIPTLPSSQQLQVKMQAVDQVVSGLLGQVDLNLVHLPSDLEGQKRWLAELGFSDKVISIVWDQLNDATALSYKTDRDERARKEFLYSFVNELAQNEPLDRDLGMSLLVDFVRSTRAKATFFTMLLRTPRLIQDLARIFCLSPYLGSILAQRPELLDHFILQVDEAWANELETLLLQMTERKLLTELWSANQYLADKDMPSMFQRISQTADAIGRQLLYHLKSEYPGSSVEIITLGKWGGSELGLRSDLDFIFVTTGPPNESDFKVARRFISRLTDPTRGGCLYDLDLRLRPSGQSGALIVAQDQLMDYWKNSAAPWERQAYLRSRPLNENLQLKKEYLFTDGLMAAELVELKEIRAKLLRPISSEKIDIKYAPGGLLDIEFVCQTAILAEALNPSSTSTLGMLEALAETHSQWRAHSTELKSIYIKLREVEQMLQLSSMHKTVVAQFGSVTFQKTTSLLGMSTEAGWQWLGQLLVNSRQILNKLDPTGLKI